jgi:hypothetical protein
VDEPSTRGYGWTGTITYVHQDNYLEKRDHVQTEIDREETWELIADGPKPQPDYYRSQTMRCAYSGKYRKLAIATVQSGPSAGFWRRQENRFEPSKASSAKTTVLIQYDHHDVETGWIRMSIGGVLLEGAMTREETTSRGYKKTLTKPFATSNLSFIIDRASGAVDVAWGTQRRT